MIWADRLAIVWGLICFGLASLNAYDKGHAFTLAAFAVFVPWILLRGLDFIFSGTIRGIGRRA